MVSNRQHRRTGYRAIGIVAALLLLIPCTGVWSQGTGRHAEDTRPRSAAKGRAVVVQEGRLSVDLQEADLGEVLAQIGRQAGIRMSSGPSSGKRISAHFAGLELEEGLRRLLRLASLSHSFLYAKGPAGTVTPSQPLSPSRACNKASKIPALQSARLAGKPQKSQNRYKSRRLMLNRGNQARLCAACSTRSPGASRWGPDPLTAKPPPRLSPSRQARSQWTSGRGPAELTVQAWRRSNSSPTVAASITFSYRPPVEAGHRR
jgi:hypothetical protein